MKTARWFIGTIAMILGPISYAVAATEQEDKSSSIAVWTFLGLCALIIIGQLLPALRAVTPKEKIVEQPLAEAAATADVRQDEPGGPAE